MSINRLYVFTDGVTTLRYNDGKAAVTYDSNSYTAQSIKLSVVENTLEDNEFHLTMRSDVSPASLFRDAHPARQWRIAVLEVDGTLITRGTLMAIEYELDKRQAKLTFSGGGAYAESDLPQDVTSRTCQNALFDSDCRLVRTGYEVAIDVVDLTITGNVIEDTTGAIDALADGYFSYGFIECGNAVAMIVNHVGDTLTLMTPLDVTGDTEVIVLPGCNKTTAHCISKFGSSNIVNFRGVPHTPGTNPTVDGVITR